MTKSKLAIDKETKAHPTQRPPEIDIFVDAFLSTVCDTSRRYILEILSMPEDEEGGELPEKRSGEIAKIIGLASATTSEHLKQLTDAGLVRYRREGNAVYYSLRNRTLVKAFRDLLKALDKDYALLHQIAIQQQEAQAEKLKKQDLQ